MDSKLFTKLNLAFSCSFDAFLCVCIIPPRCSGALHWHLGDLGLLVRTV